MAFFLPILGAGFIVDLFNKTKEDPEPEPEPDPEDEKDSTLSTVLMYIGIGFGVLIVGLIIYFFVLS